MYIILRYKFSLGKPLFLLNLKLVLLLGFAANFVLFVTFF